MQSNDDLKPFLGLTASTVERSQLKKQIQFQGNPCVDQSSSDEEDLESSPSSKSSSQFLPVGYLKGQYKSESSLMTCEAELHGSVIRMPSSLLSLIGTEKVRSGHHLAGMKLGRETAWPRKDQKG